MSSLYRSVCGALILGVALVTAAAAAPNPVPDSKARQALDRLKKARQEPTDPTPTTTSTTETYEVGAQYRGTLKKSFDDLGTARLDCRTLSATAFQMELDGKVKHPESGKLLEFTVHRRFKLDGNAITVTQQHDKFNAESEPHRTRLVDAVSLAYLVKRQIRRKAVDPYPSREYTLAGRTFLVTRQASGKWEEITVKDANGVIAKFFLSPPVGGLHPVSKFRIFAKNKIVISFLAPGINKPTSEVNAPDSR